MEAEHLKVAQMDVYQAASKLRSAGLQLDGTKYEDQYRKAFEAVRELNKILINAVKGA